MLLEKHAIIVGTAGLLFIKGIYGKETAKGGAKEGIQTGFQGYKARTRRKSNKEEAGNGVGKIRNENIKTIWLVFIGNRC